MFLSTSVIDTVLKLNSADRMSWNCQIVVGPWIPNGFVFNEDLSIVPSMSINENLRASFAGAKR